MATVITKEIEQLIGKTMISVFNNENYELVFKGDDGITYEFYHSQECCEDVKIHDICGELEDLIGSPIVGAEENSSEFCKGMNECGTWTFYRFATVKGTVTVRWLGESNGYYSESVDFRTYPTE